MRSHGVFGALLTGIVLVPVLAAAEVSVNINVGPPPPLVVVAPPPLIVVPGVPVVQYAPALQVDLFFTGGRWYYWHGGHWFLGSSYRGPWTYVVVEKVPHAILTVPARYYRIPPGHLKKMSGGPPGHAGPPPGHGKGKGRGRD